MAISPVLGKLTHMSNLIHNLQIKRRNQVTHNTQLTGNFKFPCCLGCCIDQLYFSISTTLTWHIVNYQVSPILQINATFNFTFLSEQVFMWNASSGAGTW